MIPPYLERDQLALSQADLVSGGLPKASIAKLGKLVTVDQSIIRKTLGTISPPTLASVLRGVHDVLS